MEKPGIRVSRRPSERELTKWLSTVEGFTQGLTEVDEQPTRLADYQIDFMRNKSKFRAVEKARGVGFSFGCAAEALAKAHLKKDHTAIFVSMNLEEAIEKIRYANLLYESLPLRWRKKKVVDNKTSLEFEDSSGRFRSRLISHPCKDPRGKHKADVYLDEFAHYGHKQRAVYVAAVPIVSRGNGQLTIGSTPLAAGDLFHDIMKQERKKYAMFTRQSIPWWFCGDLCENVSKATAEAPGLSTAERVHRFGKEILIEIFHSLDVVDFQQEYELLYADETQSYFPYELILSCCSDDLKVCESIDSLVSDCSGDFYAGFDVGRTRNKSELIVIERVKKRLYYRYGKEFDRSKFQYQEEFLRKMLKRSKRFKRLCIDKHGIGMNLAENLRTEFRSRVEGIALIGQMKESLAVDFHIAFENEEIMIPRDRKLIQQIHSIRKKATDAGYARYDTEKNETHHADKMWALALALHAAGSRKRKRKRKAIDASIV
jgi:phage FluMu gp28-like protein